MMRIPKDRVTLFGFFNTGTLMEREVLAAIYFRPITSK
jgi:hypothetical protein